MFLLLPYQLRDDLLAKSITPKFRFTLVYPMLGFLSISDCLGYAVLIFIIPFKADDPYKAEEAPLIIST